VITSLAIGGARAWIERDVIGILHT